MSLNPAVNCTFLRTRISLDEELNVFLCQQALPSQTMMNCARERSYPRARSTPLPRVRRAAVWLRNGTSPRAISSTLMTMSTRIVATLPSDNRYVCTSANETRIVSGRLTHAFWSFSLVLRVNPRVLSRKHRSGLYSG